MPFRLDFSLTFGRFNDSPGEPIPGESGDGSATVERAGDPPAHTVGFTAPTRWPYTED